MRGTEDGDGGIINQQQLLDVDDIEMKTLSPPSLF
jgi:hypothetical protein